MVWADFARFYGATYQDLVGRPRVVEYALVTYEVIQGQWGLFRRETGRVPQEPGLVPPREHDNLITDKSTKTYDSRRGNF
jgi:hypothetical protein